KGPAFDLSEYIIGIDSSESRSLANDSTTRVKGDTAGDHERAALIETHRSGALLERWCRRPRKHAYRWIVSIGQVVCRYVCHVEVCRLIGKETIAASDRCLAVSARIPGK